MSDSLQKQMNRIEEKLDTLIDQETPDRPDEYYKIRDESGNPTETTVEILREIKKGSKTDGLKTRQVQSILIEHGFDYSDTGTRNVMQRLASKYSKIKYHSRVGAKGCEIQWHPN